MNSRPKRILRDAMVIGLSLAVIFMIFRLTSAGSLTPSASPAGTMHSLQESYDALVGTFDSSSVVASGTGDAFQVTKCIINKLTGGPICP